MSLMEKISSAQVSSNLGEKPVHQMGDVDVVRACGMAGATNELGLSLYRLKYSGDVKEFPKVVDGLLTMVRSRWFDVDGHATVNAVLVHWLDDICNSCSGRGYAVVPGTPMTSTQLTTRANELVDERMVSYRATLQLKFRDYLESVMSTNPGANLPNFTPGNELNELDAWYRGLTDPTPTQESVYSALRGQIRNHYSSMGIQ